MYICMYVQGSTENQCYTEWTPCSTLQLQLQKKRRNIIYDRAKFNSRTQQEGESVEDFIHSVQALAQHCSYGTLHDQMVRDRIVVGIRDSLLSQKLQMEADLTLEKVTKMVRESEAIKKQQKTIRDKLDEAAELDSIRKGRAEKTGTTNRSKSTGHNKHLPLNRRYAPDVGSLHTERCNVQLRTKFVTDATKAAISKKCAELKTLSAR